MALLPLRDDVLEKTLQSQEQRLAAVDKRLLSLEKIMDPEQKPPLSPVALVPDYDTMTQEIYKDHRKEEMPDKFVEFLRTYINTFVDDVPKSHRSYSLSCKMVAELVLSLFDDHPETAVFMTCFHAALASIEFMRDRSSGLYVCMGMVTGAEGMITGESIASGCAAGTLNEVEKSDASGMMVAFKSGDLSDISEAEEDSVTDASDTSSVLPAKRGGRKTSPVKKKRCVGRPKKVARSGSKTRSQSLCVELGVLMDDDTIRCKYNDRTIEGTVKLKGKSPHGFVISAESGTYTTLGDFYRSEVKPAGHFDIWGVIRVKHNSQWIPIRTCYDKRVLQQYKT